MQEFAVSPEALGDELFDFMNSAGNQSHGAVLQVVLELDLTIAQLKVLFALDSEDRELALHELASVTGLSLAAASRTVDALARSGLVSRREDERDRRVKRLAATPAGKEAIARVAAARREMMRAFAETLTEEERTALSQAIAPILARHARSQPEEPTR